MTKINLLIGTRPNKKNTGIYLYEFDQKTGKASYAGVTPIKSFSHFNVSADKKFIYTISEQEAGSGKISAYKRDEKSGIITLINEKQISGVDPSYIIINKKRTYAIVANNGSGDIELFKINNDGSLTDVVQTVEFHGRGGNNNFQQKSHIQCIKFSPNEDFIIITDLGTDYIYIYKIIELDTAAYIQTTNYTYKLNVEGSGPRSFVFHPNGKYIYLITALKNLVKFYDYNKKIGSITLAQTVETSELKPRGHIHIQISPDGRFLYVTNKFERTKLSIFQINQKTGLLQQIGSVELKFKPSHFTITPNGKYLIMASRDKDMIYVYKRNMSKGLLFAKPQSFMSEQPVYIKIV